MKKIDLEEMPTNRSNWSHLMFSLTRKSKKIEFQAELDSSQEFPNMSKCNSGSFVLHIFIR